MMIRYCNIFLCALLIGCNIPLEKQTKEELPNILFLFADDFTYDAINALGNDIIQTPNLDRLVQNGTHFSQAFNMGGWNGAVCMASRAMIITGKSIWRAKTLTDQWKNKNNIEANFLEEECFLGDKGLKMIGETGVDREER